MVRSMSILIHQDLRQGKSERKANGNETDKTDREKEG